MPNPQPAPSAHPAQAKILGILAQADYRDVLRIDREDTAALRRELAGVGLDAAAFQDQVRAWLGRTWIIDVSTIIIDANETSSLKM